MSHTLKLIIFTFIVFSSSLTYAENSTEINGYVIHHNAITTDILSPEIARHYGIIRSRNRAMLNVSVLKKGENPLGEAVSAEIKAYTTNLFGQQRRLNLREVREGAAIYYIGDFLIRNGDRLNFHVDVKPDGETSYTPASFSQEFFTE